MPDRARWIEISKEPVHPQAARAATRLDENETIRVAVVVRPRSSDEERLVAIRAVKAFARESGLQVSRTGAAGRIIVISGAIRALSTAFRIEPVLMAHGEQSYRSHRGSIRVPKRLSGVIEAVVGLDDRLAARRHLHVGGNVASDDTDPRDVARHYRFPPNARGRGQCIGIIELGGGFRRSDLKSYFAARKLSVPRIKVVEIEGAANKPASQASIRHVLTAVEAGKGAPESEELKWTLETTGDIELIGALAPEAKIVIYFAPNSERGMLQALNTAIHDSENRPSVISCSWGNHEDEYSGPHVLTGMDSILQDAVLKGITLCFSSGDDGDGAGKDGKPRVEFPASSPHVLACGGTHMTISGNGTKETVWKEKVLPGQVWASGGGFSSVFEIPPWQASAGAMRRNHAVNKRGVPDVASKADITKNGYRVVAGGLSVCLGGGTSAAAPVWAALIANLNESLGRPVGYLTPLLYSDRFRRTTRDITRGNNGRYKAHTGWDACTGWGSPIGTALLAALRGM